MSTRANRTFGPAVSRRLGRSLGVEIVPAKVCTFNCVYCEAGRTTRLTTERREYVPVDEILYDVRQRFDQGVKADYVTITGAGEPTLHSGLAAIVDGIRRITRTPIAVLTNGSLLGERDVQKALAGVDLVVPSLDAGTDEEFHRVNRPASGFTVEALVTGMESFRARYKGQIWLEVLLVAGLTDSEESVKRIARLAERIRPDRIQLNTVVRPPAEASAGAVPAERLAALARLFTPAAEVIAVVPHRHSATTTIAVGRSDVLALVERRPCPLEEIAEGLGMAPDAVAVHLKALEDSGLVQRQERDGVVYYTARQESGETEV